MKYKEYNDQELISMIRESSEEAKDILYDKYKYIIDIELKKYNNLAVILGYDYNDLYQDALVGFSDAIANYREDKEASLPYFITLCVDRKLQYAIRSVNNKKSRLQSESLSLEYVYDDSSLPLIETISGSSLNDPLLKMMNEEDYNELSEKIEKELSVGEYEVYKYMIKGLKYNEIALILGKEPKQIDNAMQRIKNKVKRIVNKL